jgi:hypothetical protein
MSWIILGSTLDFEPIDHLILILYLNRLLLKLFGSMFRVQMSQSMDTAYYFTGVRNTRHDPLGETALATLLK